MLADLTKETFWSGKVPADVVTQPDQERHGLVPRAQVIGEVMPRRANSQPLQEGRLS
jgi:hypothetical protein